MPAIEQSYSTPVVLQSDFVNIVGTPSIGFDEVEITRDSDALMRFYAPASTSLVMVAGSASGSATEIPLASNGQALALGSPGIPVDVASQIESVAVSFLADSAPATWTLSLMRRRNGAAAFTTEATVTVNTS